MRLGFLLVFSMFFLVLFLKPSFASTINVNQCFVASANNTVYNLTGSFTNTTASVKCMDFSGPVFNNTLECNGYNINGTNSATTYGIYIKRSSNQNTNITIQNCNITNWYYGFYTSATHNNTFTNNTVNSSTWGFYLSGSNNTFTNNTVNSSTWGFYLAGAYNNTLTNNKITASHTSSSAQQGLYLDFAFSKIYFINNITETNTINNLPILYIDSVYRTCPNNTVYINGSSYSYMGFVGCNNITVMNSSPTDEILLASTTNSTISNISISYSKYPILLSTYANYNNITNNIVNNNYFGFFLYASSSNNTFTNNTANSNVFGFSITYCNNNTVKNSIIQNSSSYGISVYMSVDLFNSIYNNLLNNTNNFFAGIDHPSDVRTDYLNTTRQIGTRIYSNGTEIGGNYWTNSTGNGYSDTCTDSNKDGFCDNNYTLAKNNIDYLPLSNKYDGPPTYSSNSTNSTVAGTPISHNLYWTDDNGLSGYIFSFDNCTGSLSNDTWTSMTGATNWSNVTKIINSTLGCTIRWCVYANDTSNNWNGTSCSSPFTYATTVPDTTPPTYSNLWQNVTNDTVVGTTIIGFGAQWNDNVGLGMFVNSSNISGWANGTWASFTTGNWSNFTIDTTGITAGAVFQFKIYANDTSNNQNVTGVWQYTKDGTPPTYSSNSTNSTYAGTPILHSLNWTDNVGLSGYIFSFDNCTGSLTNDTWASMTGTTNWSNVTKVINSTSCTISWCVYVNDTSNNWNGTSCSSPFTYDTTSAGTFISISVSQAILDGIMFETIDPDTDDNEAVNNSNGPDGGTAYNITIDPSTNVNVDLYHDTIGNLESDSYVILIGNVTHNANTTSNDGENLISSGSIALDTAYSIMGDTICQNLAADSDCWIRYWLDVPSNQPPGDYETTYEYCVVETGVGSGDCS